MREVMVYGLRQGETERYAEELLAAFPNNSLAARNVAAVQDAASRDGFHSFRVANWSGEAPNFGAAVLG